MEYFDIARQNMVKNQIMPSHVHNPDILDALYHIPRHEFVEGNMQSIAYSDARLNIGGARVMLSPEVLARMIMALTPQEHHAALDVGCGNGYSSALLAELCGSVVAIDNTSGFVKSTAANIKRLNISNVKVLEASYKVGAPADGPFDIILVNGAISGKPIELAKQLKQGGKLAYIEQRSAFLCKVMLLENVGHTMGAIELFDTFCELMEA